MLISNTCDYWAMLMLKSLSYSDVSKKSNFNETCTFSCSKSLAFASNSVPRQIKHRSIGIRASVMCAGISSASFPMYEQSLSEQKIGSFDFDW